MMRKVAVKYFGVLGVLVFGGVLLYYLSLLFLFNAIMPELFSYHRVPISTNTRIDRDQVVLTYQYEYYGKQCTRSVEMARSYYEKGLDCDNDLLLMNDHFSFIAYLKCYPLEIRKAWIGFIISGILFIVILMLWRLASCY